MELQQLKSSISGITQYAAARKEASTIPSSGRETSRSSALRASWRHVVKPDRRQALEVARRVGRPRGRQRKLAQLREEAAPVAGDACEGVAAGAGIAAACIDDSDIAGAEAQLAVAVEAVAPVADDADADADASIAVAAAAADFGTAA
eukprot:2861726-Pleurochrysis_carterae.AAC.4